MTGTELQYGFDFTKVKKIVADNSGAIGQGISTSASILRNRKDRKSQEKQSEAILKQKETEQQSKTKRTILIIGGSIVGLSAIIILITVLKRKK